MLRYMMVREEGQQVHLLSVISPDWMGAGKEIRVEHAPTEFGEVAYTLTQPDDHSAQISLNMRWRQKPDSVILHLPWFADVSEVKVDGKPVSHGNGVVFLPTDAHEVRLSWTRRPDAPNWSYDQAVESYKQEYRRRYDIYMHGDSGR